MLAVSALATAPVRAEPGDQSWPWPAQAIERMAVEALLAPTLTAQNTHTVRVRRGETLDRVLARVGVDDAGERHNAIDALGDVFDMRTLQAGQMLTVYVEADSADARVAGLAFEPDTTRTVHLSRAASGAFHARDFVIPLTRRVVRATGEVRRSLYVDALRAGVHHATIVEIADLLAYSVDFQRQIHPGDPFDIVFEEWVSPDGQPVRAGALLSISFQPRGRALEYWRFVDSTGREGFYDADGESARRLLMKTPINGARLSSHFGNRRHPILGYTRMHKGTDFAAPTGTPIYAAGDGVVERANRFGGYGNYVRIRHANHYKTAYAHLHRFARGIRAGARVRQGDVIGYVGSTGRSTGPHLHYEVMLRGVHMNPMRLNAPTGRSLDSAEMPAFEAARARLDGLRQRADKPAGAVPPAPESEPASPTDSRFMTASLDSQP